MKKVFIAGHRGMVGSALMRSVPVAVSAYTAKRNELDLTNTKEVEHFLQRNRIDAVILAAAKVGGIGANSTEQYNFLLQNLLIQNSVLNAAKRARISNLIFLGSSCIYPKLASQPMKESSLLTGPLEPTNEGYAIAKIAGVRMCKAISDETGLNFFSLMPTNLYGPNDNFDEATSHVPAALMARLHHAKAAGKASVEIWGTGVSLREFMHVDDLADACWFFLESECQGRHINIGSGQEVSIHDFARLMAKTIGYEGEIHFDPTKPSGAPRKLLDTSFASSKGWRASIRLEQGLRLTYEWFKTALKNGDVRGL